MEDPLPMARVVLEQHKGDVSAARAFIRRQHKAAKTGVLQQFWKDVEAILQEADRKPGKKADKKVS